MSCSELTIKGKQCSREGVYAGCCLQHATKKLTNSSQGVKLEKVVKATDGKHKLTAIFDVDGKEKRVNFGAEGYQDYTLFYKHDKAEAEEHKRRYVIRHTKDLRTHDVTSPGYLSMYILWNKPTIEASIKDYKKQFNV